jgi:hypothetical protein
LLHGSNNSTIKARDARRRITAAEMMYIKKQQDKLGRIKKKYRDCKRIKFKANFGKMQDCGRNWIKKVNRMPVTDYRG